jgi:hypothetical protein
VDDITIGNNKYKLVMIGRKLNEDNDYHLLNEINADGNSSHIITSEVFNESREKFGKNTQKDEGVIKYYLRHVYMVVSMFFAVSVGIYAY